MLNRYSRGDTLIEVLFAVAVFSLIAVGALSLMNQGLASSQRSVEITQVRQEIDSQAETIRFMHDSYVVLYQSGITFNLTDGPTNTSPAEEWYKMMATAPVMSAANFASNATTCPAAPAKSFVVDPNTSRFISTPTTFTPAVTRAMLNYNPATGTFVNSQGIYVQAVKSGTSSDPAQQSAGYVDFHIRACWDAPGLNQPMTLGTIVRLYEPRG